ncbi:alpha/beta fold hydrolase [Spirosoma sp. HMF3257]|uniref:Alpha/beta hydrolase n=1 Tax=Spirosoma telluris TaxID=2183553 RepID=A0A327NJ28_9BACT|nr:alpha/beta fold hydrolase [Spirosoma telluris]RAI74349.1 alpha/beta hydrolase [Spirosoma telluris]
MKSLIHEETAIHYVVAGNKLPTLVFVHGADIDLTYWKAQLAYFADHYSVIALDLPGHGKSGREKPQWSVKTMGEEVATFIKSLALEQVILIGHSMGGDVNLVAATTYPDPIIGFIGIDNFKNAGQPLSPQYQQQSKEIIRHMQADFANTNEQYARMVLLTPQTPDAVVKRVVQDYRNAYQPMATAIIEEVFEDGYKLEQDLLPKLPCKLHLINVDYSPTDEGPLQQYVTAGYEVHHMAGTSHFPMIENPHELNRLLEETIITEIPIPHEDY